MHPFVQNNQQYYGNPYYPSRSLVLPNFFHGQEQQLIAPFSMAAYNSCQSYRPQPVVVVVSPVTTINFLGTSYIDFPQNQQQQQHITPYAVDYNANTAAYNQYWQNYQQQSEAPLMPPGTTAAYRYYVEPPSTATNYYQNQQQQQPIAPHPSNHSVSTAACEQSARAQIPTGTSAPCQSKENVDTHLSDTLENYLQRTVPTKPGTQKDVQNSGATGSTEQCSNIEAIMEEVNEIISTMVGLDGLKLQLTKWIKGLVLNQKRKTLGLNVGTRKPLHMAFLGNPGTGKTMVARHLGKILHKLGLVSTDKVTEVQRTDLVAEYIGQTGPKTRKKIKEARGGILFVDEAYRLMPPDISKDTGREALEEIMEATDNGDITTIFAGYSEEMDCVITSNPGFSRRVSNIFHFDDYSPRDIAMILQSKIKNQEEGSSIFGFKLHPDCTVKTMTRLIKEHTTEEQLKAMNGGLVDPLLVKTLENMDLRLDENCTDPDTLTTITMKDLEEGLKSLSDCKKKGSKNEKNTAIPSMFI